MLEANGRDVYRHDPSQSWTMVDGCVAGEDEQQCLYAIERDIGNCFLKISILPHNAHECCLLITWDCQRCDVNMNPKESGDEKWLRVQHGTARSQSAGYENFPKP